MDAAHISLHRSRVGTFFPGELTNHVSPELVSHAWLGIVTGLLAVVVATVVAVIVVVVAVVVVVAGGAAVVAGGAAVVAGGAAVVAGGAVVVDGGVVVVADFLNETAPLDGLVFVHCELT